VSTVSTKKCIQGGCKIGQGPWCRTCGMNTKEAKRREKIPLTMGTDGLMRKYLGIKGTEEAPQREAPGTKGGGTDG